MSRASMPNELESQLFVSCCSAAPAPGEATGEAGTPRLPPLLLFPRCPSSRPTSRPSRLATRLPYECRFATGERGDRLAHRREAIPPGAGRSTISATGDQYASQPDDRTCTRLGSASASFTPSASDLDRRLAGAWTRNSSSPRSSARWHGRQPLSALPSCSAPSSRPF
jgi:hypothetical protein